MEEYTYLRALTAPPCQAVIVALMGGDALSVAQLHRQTGMSAAALSRALGQLSRLGLLQQTVLPSSGGRPARSYLLRREPLERLHSAVRQLQAELRAAD